MKPVLWVLIAIVSCGTFAVGGYAAGAYMQFLRTFALKQDTFARDIITAQGLARNRDSELLEWMRNDIPLQYQFLTDYEAMRNASLPVRLSMVARMTWRTRSTGDEGIRSAERWRKMIRECECGLSAPAGSQP